MPTERGWLPSPDEPPYRLGEEIVKGRGFRQVGESPRSVELAEGELTGFFKQCKPRRDILAAVRAELQGGIYRNVKFTDVKHAKLPFGWTENMFFEYVNGLDRDGLVGLIHAHHPKGLSLGDVLCPSNGDMQLTLKAFSDVPHHGVHVITADMYEEPMGLEGDCYQSVTGNMPPHTRTIAYEYQGVGDILQVRIRWDYLRE